MKKLPDTFRVIYTTADGVDREGAPLAREAAMANFAREVATAAKNPLRGRERIRVLSEAEWAKAGAR